MAFRDLLEQVGTAHVQEMETLRLRYESKLKNALKENLKLREELQRFGLHTAMVMLEDKDQQHAQVGAGSFAVSQPRAPNQVVLHDDLEVSSPEHHKRFKLLPGWQRAISGDAEYALDFVMDYRKRSESWGRQELPGGRSPTRYGCVILPGSTFRMAWEVIGLVLISYDLLTIPFTQAFQPAQNLFTRCADWITLIYWSLDMVQGFFVGYFEKGEVVTDHWKIVRSYVKSWLVIDIIVVMPEWLVLIVLLGVDHEGEGAEMQLGTFGKVARFARVARILRLLRLLKMKKLLNLMADRIDSEYTFILFNLILLLCFVVVLNHVIACGWYFVGRMTMAQGMNNWVTIGAVNGTKTSYLYATSLHWSLTQFIPAPVEISARNFPERVFSIVVLLFAMIVFSSIVASITASMTALRSLQGDEMRQFWLLRRYLRQRNIPSRLSNRIIKFLEHRCKVQGRLVQIEKVPVLLGLSEALHNELTHELHSAELVAHPFFGHLNTEMSGVMHRLCHLALNLQCFAEKEVTFNAGDEAKKMFFVKSGEYEYIDIAGEPVSPALQAKEWLSEPVLYTDWRHKGDLLAQTEAELITVDPSQYMSVMSVHPRPWQYAQNYAAKLLEVLNNYNPQDLTDVIRHPTLYKEVVLDSDGAHTAAITSNEWDMNSPLASPRASRTSDESAGDVSTVSIPCRQGGCALSTSFSGGGAAPPSPPQRGGLRGGAAVGRGGGHGHHPLPAIAATVPLPPTLPAASLLLSAERAAAVAAAAAAAAHHPERPAERRGSWQQLCLPCSRRRSPAQWLAVSVCAQHHGSQRGS